MQSPRGQRCSPPAASTGAESCSRHHSSWGGFIPAMFRSQVPRAFRIPVGTGAGSGPASTLRCVRCDLWCPSAPRHRALPCTSLKNSIYCYSEHRQLSRESWSRGGASLFKQTAKKDNLTRDDIYPADRSCFPRLGSFCFTPSILDLGIPAWLPGADPGWKGCSRQPWCQTHQFWAKLPQSAADSLSPLPSPCFWLEMGFIIPLHREILKGAC